MSCRYMYDQLSDSCDEEAVLLSKSKVKPRVFQSDHSAFRIPEKENDEDNYRRPTVMRMQESPLSFDFNEEHRVLRPEEETFDKYRCQGSRVPVRGRFYESAPIEECPDPETPAFRRCLTRCQAVGSGDFPSASSSPLSMSHDMWSDDPDLRSSPASQKSYTVEPDDDLFRPMSPRRVSSRHRPLRQSDDPLSLEQFKRLEISPQVRRLDRNRDFRENLESSSELECAPSAEQHIARIKPQVKAIGHLQQDCGAGGNADESSCNKKEALERYRKTKSEDFQITRREVVAHEASSGYGRSGQFKLTSSVHGSAAQIPNYEPNPRYDLSYYLASRCPVEQSRKNKLLKKAKKKVGNIYIASKRVVRDVVRRASSPGKPGTKTNSPTLRKSCENRASSWSGKVAAMASTGGVSKYLVSC